MSKFDKEYHSLLNKIMNEGYIYEDPNRQGVNRKEIESYTLRQDLTKGFPAITTKEAYFKGAVGEMLFFLSGSTDIRDLWKHGVRFWDKDWARFRGYTEEQVKELYRFYKKGEVGAYGINYDMGAIYPKQYRNFGGVDQFYNLVNTLKNNPMSTSLIVNAWNPSELPLMCLPPCHYGFQVTARPLSEIEMIKYNVGKSSTRPVKYGFTIHWEQRSTDVFLGTPVNIMYYSLVALLLEKLTGHKALAVQGNLRNVHLYDNQFDAVKEQLSRDTDKYQESFVSFPGLDEDFWKYDVDVILNTLKVSDFVLNNYESYPAIKVDMLSYQ